MKCRSEKCPNKAQKGRRQGYCLKHYDRLPARGFVDAGPVRERLRELRRCGYGHRQLAETLGMTRQGMEWILQGKSSRVQQSTWNAVMAIPVPSSVVAMGALVSTLGTRRRVQALAVLGWPQCEIAARAGVAPKTLSRAMTQPSILATNATAVAAVFDALQMTSGPSEWVRMRAVKHGWPPPLAWDNPDDPDEVPDVGADVRAPFMDRLAELEYLNIRVSEMPVMLGIDRESFERALSRHSLKEAV